jgi:magnesium transporter
LVIPNSILSEDRIINSSIKDESTCEFVEFELALHADVGLAISLLQHQALLHPDRVQGPDVTNMEKPGEAITVRVTKINEGAVTLRMYVWGKGPRDGAAHALRPERGNAGDLQREQHPLRAAHPPCVTYGPHAPEPDSAWPSIRSEKAGLPPGSLVPVSEDPEVATTIQVMVYNADSFTEHCAVTADKIDVGDPGKTVTWIDVAGLADIKAITAIGEQFGLHQLLLEDVLNTDHRPTIDEYQENLFVVVKMLTMDPESEDVWSEQVSFVLGQGVVISFQSEPGDVMEPVRERLRNNIGRLRKKGADFLLYSLLDVIVDNYFVIVEDLGKRIEIMEERVVRRPREKDLLDMQALRRQLVGISRQVTPTRELAGRMNITPSKLIDKSTRRYINDLQDHTVYISESIGMFRDQLTNLENTYHAGLNMRMGQVMKLLTVISTIFIPLTFIVGVYGMNFKNMPELEWRYGYYAVMGVMLFISLVMLVLFRRKGWL